MTSQAALLSVAAASMGVFYLRLGEDVALYRRGEYSRAERLREHEGVPDAGAGVCGLPGLPRRIRLLRGRTWARRPGRSVRHRASRRTRLSWTVRRPGSHAVSPCPENRGKRPGSSPSRGSRPSRRCPRRRWPAAIWPNRYGSSTIGVKKSADCKSRPPPNGMYPASSRVSMPLIKPSAAAGVSPSSACSRSPGENLEAQPALVEYFVSRMRVRSSMETIICPPSGFLLRQVIPVTGAPVPSTMGRRCLGTRRCL